MNTAIPDFVHCGVCRTRFAPQEDSPRPRQVQMTAQDGSGSSAAELAAAKEEIEKLNRLNRSLSSKLHKSEAEVKQLQNTVAMLKAQIELHEAEADEGAV